MRAAALCFMALLSAWSLEARGQPSEDLQADVSAREIAIESNFTGHHVVVFGAVENYPRYASPARSYDVIVVIRGPADSFTAWRKRKTAGIWLNRDARDFRDVPGFYATLSTRPVEQIAPRAILEQHRIGFANVNFGPPPRGVPASRDAAFRGALVRLLAEENLYQSKLYGVTFVGGGLFRASIDLPANVPIGQFRADVYLFKESNLIASAESRFSIGKAGFERFMTRLATEDPVVYGLAALLVAFGIGLAAALMARE